MLTALFAAIVAAVAAYFHYVLLFHVPAMITAKLCLIIDRAIARGMRAFVIVCHKFPLCSTGDFAKFGNR
jgi:hypothetical protein